ncbi:MAG TPA: hypothetical protein VHP58_07010 [Alphaproteobacteria bacterium]|nr:hypothetical protein [Alphaproteobacteria bacterium]
MRFYLPAVLVLLPLAAQAGVHMQPRAQVLDPAIVTPTHITSMPAAVGVTPSIVRAAPEPVVVTDSMAGFKKISASAVVSATQTSPTVMTPGMAAPGQCVAGLRIISQLALVAYDAKPSKVFMRIASFAAVAEPYAANGVPPNLKGLQGAIDDMPFNGAGVAEIQQAYTITKTACAGIMKPQQK